MVLPAASENQPGLKVTSLGTTSFLLDDGTTQILIDGFVTRRPWIWKGVEPHLKTIKHAMKRHHIRANVSSFAPDARCRDDRGGGLSLIIPGHGHYDHAVDVGYWAALTGACVLGDGSIQAVINATEALNARTGNKIRWPEISRDAPFRSNEQTIRDVTAGRFHIKLIRAHHLTTPIHVFLDGNTSDDLTFPSSVFAMQEGTNVAIHVTHGRKTILIVPSAGRLFDTVSPEEIRADIVFLGIGALSVRGQGYRTRYWQSAVEAPCAQRVIPIHWDQDVKPTDLGNQFKPKSAWRLKRLVRFLERAGESRGIDIAFAPAQVAFDPFVGLSQEGGPCAD